MTKINASQAAVKLGREKKIDLGEVKGTGAGGQITKGDVAKFLDGAKAKEANPDTTKPEESAEAAAAGNSAGAEGTATSPTDGEKPLDAALDQAGAGATTKAAEKAAQATHSEIAEESDAKTLPIVKAREGIGSAWWCPHCDFSQPGEQLECGGCGAVRKGDRVAVLGDEVTKS